MPDLRPAFRLIVVAGWVVAATHLVFLLWWAYLIATGEVGLASAGWSFELSHVLMTSAVLLSLLLQLPSARQLGWVVCVLQVLAIARGLYFLLDGSPVNQSIYWIGVFGSAASLVLSVVLTAMCVIALRAPIRAINPPNPTGLAPQAPAAPVGGGVWRSAQEAAAGSAPSGEGTITDPKDPWRRGTPPSTQIPS